jgi:hypothetical protein
MNGVKARDEVIENFEVMNMSEVAKTSRITENCKRFLYCVLWNAVLHCALLNCTRYRSTITTVVKYEIVVFCFWTMSTSQVWICLDMFF